MTQEQLSELRSIYYDFVYVRAYHNSSPIAERMAQIDERFEKLVKDLMTEEITSKRRLTYEG